MSLNHLDIHPVGGPCVMVIFGATGDLTKRKLIPALCNLASDGLLSKQFAIIGYATNDFTTETFRKMLTDEIPKYTGTPVDQKLWSWFLERIYYIKADFADATAYQRLKEQIALADKQHNTEGNKFFYLAVAPRFFRRLSNNWGTQGSPRKKVAIGRA